MDDLKASLGERFELLSPWVNELGRKLVILPAGSIVNLYDVGPAHSAPGIVRGSTPRAYRVASESPADGVESRVPWVALGASSAGTRPR